MKHLRLLVTSGMLVWAGAARAETRVVVLPITASGTKVDSRTAALITDRLTTELAKRADLKVIGTTEIETLTSVEQQKQMLNCSDNSCLAEIGAALGADYTVSGTLGDLGSLYVINLHLLDAKKAISAGRVSDEVSSPDQLVVLMPYLAGSLTRNIPGGPPPPPRPALPQPVHANPAPSPTPPPAGPAAKPVEESGGGSSLVRRLLGAGVAVVGGVGVLAGVVVGVGSIAYLLAGWFAVQELKTIPGRAGGFGIAAVADGLGIAGMIILGAGILIAAFP